MEQLQQYSLALKLTQQSIGILSRLYKSHIQCGECWTDAAGDFVNALPEAACTDNNNTADVAITFANGGLKKRGQVAGVFARCADINYQMKLMVFGIHHLP